MSGKSKDDDDDTSQSNGPSRIQNSNDEMNPFASSDSISNNNENYDQNENCRRIRPRKRRIKHRKKLSVSTVTTSMNNTVPIQRNNGYSFQNNNGRRADKKQRCYGSNKNANTIDGNKKKKFTIEENHSQNFLWSQRILHRRRKNSSHASTFQNKDYYNRFLPTLLQFRETGYYYAQHHQNRSIFHYKRQQSSNKKYSFRGYHCHENWKIEILQRLHTEIKSTENNKSFNGKEKISSEAMEKWRLYTHRSLPFSRLQTPFTDAILSLDRNGLYMMSLGIRNHNTQQQHIYNHNDEEEMQQISINDTNEYNPALSINFYGVPNPAVLSSAFQRRKKRNISPILLTIPLLFRNNDDDENRNFIAPSSLLGRDEVSSVTTTPVHILTTGDGILGVSILQHSSSSHSYIIPTLPDATFVESPAIQEEDCLGTIVLFPLPSLQSSSTDLVKTFRLENVRINGRNGHTLRNLLWKTRKIPCHSTMGNYTNNGNSDFRANCQNMKLFDSYYNTTWGGYIFFNDEDDGFRILWMEVSSWKFTATKNTIRKDGSSSKLGIIPKRRDIIIEEDDLDGLWSDSRSGKIVKQDPKHAKNHNFSLRRHAYFRVDALLCDILQRRKGSLCKALFQDLPSDANDEIESGTLNRIVLPDFFYNLISFGEDSRIAFIVIVFCNKSVDSTNENHRATSTIKKKQSFSGNKSPASIGVFIKIDLFDQSYQEINWVQHPSKCDQLFLRRWCNTLATNARMKEVGAGVFSIRENGDEESIRGKSIGLFVSTYDCDNEEQEDDCDDELWRNILENSLQNEQKRKQKKISMSSLYPFCDHTSNKAVIEHIPVPYIKARDYPLMLCYG